MKDLSQEAQASLDLGGKRRHDFQYIALFRSRKLPVKWKSPRLVLGLAGCGTGQVWKNPRRIGSPRTGISATWHGAAARPRWGARRASAASGAEGSRTPVPKQIERSLYACIH